MKRFVWGAWLSQSTLMFAVAIIGVALFAVTAAAVYGGHDQTPKAVPAVPGDDDRPPQVAPVVDGNVDQPTKPVPAAYGDGNPPSKTLPAVQGDDDQPTKPLTFVDPRVRMAQSAKQEAERHEAELNDATAAILKEIQTAVDAMSLSRPDAEKLAIDGLRKLAAQGTAMSKKLLAKHGSFKTSAMALKGVYQRAPSTFREAANAYEKFAEEETYAEIKADYLQMRDTMNEFARRMERRVGELDTETTKIAETMKYVERSGLFLERLDAHLATYPDLSVGDERKKFLDQLQRYVLTYESLRTSLHAFNDQIKKQSSEASPPSPAVVPARPAATPPVAPSTPAVTAPIPQPDRTPAVLPPPVAVPPKPSSNSAVPQPPVAVPPKPSSTSAVSPPPATATTIVPNGSGAGRSVSSRSDIVLAEDLAKRQQQPPPVAKYVRLPDGRVVLVK